MSRIQQDQFVDDDEDECCPLCVEEFDLSDKNFRPCPCGYQICQFCFNNIRTTMNGLCPACRRPYDESTIEFKNITPEEMARHKQQIMQKAKKNAAMRQKEAQKAEADSLSRKHLAGLRVVQKNLVYVTGLTPTIREDRLLDTLRGDDYFGQYGKIIKIVVSKAKENAQYQQSVGVYVTFARKEDAASCIAAVDGSQNGERTLRAQYGTTKYCSAYLRGEQCNNRNCMFLHEPGEENDSFTRQDLSLMNSISTQQPAQSQSSQSAPPQHRGPAVAAATPMNRQESSEAPSPTQSNPAPGLPPTASWGSKATLERRTSRSTSASNPSPMTSNAIPVQPSKPAKAEEPSTKKKGKDKDKSGHTSKSATPQPQPTPAPVSRPVQPRVPGFDGLLKVLADPNFKFIFSSAMLSAEDMEEIKNFPPLLDPNGGAKRRAMKDKEREKELELLRQAEAEAATQAVPPSDGEETAETTMGGSLQLGGEPEERPDAGVGHSSQHSMVPPGQHILAAGLFGQSNLNEDFQGLNMNNRTLTTQQQQHLKSQAPPSAGLLSTFAAAQAQQPPHTQAGASGHTRHASRFSFANDSASASASVQPVANQKLMSQQASMMPKNAGHFNQMAQHQQLGGQFYTSGVQGPPPGLKATGTPPVSGGGIFSQGHGFATGGLGYGANAAGRNNDAMYQDLLRGRNVDGGSRIADAGKRESMFPSFLNQHPTTSTPAPAPGPISFPYGPSPGAYQDSGSQKSKKKGKKHRHANTSSSGGGVVDVQDPSILQARLHQGGGMVGQGLYAGQGQDEQVFDPEDEVSINVDALVNDNEPPVPPKPLTIASQASEQSQRAAPSIPPGFTAPAVPKLPEHASLPMSRTASANILPAVPVIPITPLRAATPVKTKEKETERKPVETPEAADSKATSNTPPTSSRKIETPTKPGRRASTKSQVSVEVSKRRKADEGSSLVDEKSKEASAILVEHKSPSKETPNKGTPKGKAPSKKVQAILPVDSNAPKDVANQPTLPATAPSSIKRQHPGKLDIAAATKLPEPEASSATILPKADTQQKSTRTVSLAATGSVPASPAATSTGSPIKRTSAPRTLRVVQTPRTEVPPPLSAISTTSLPQIPTVDKLRSRQASIASINLPGTPASEMISEDASVTSASVSRANSPPPIGGKVGSAPMRKKTKSQAKKDRQERARQIAEEEAIALEENVKSDHETVHAPIVGRKKKAKKPTTVVPKAAIASAKSQPASPKPATVKEEKEKPVVQAVPVPETPQIPNAKAPASSPRKAPSPPKPEPLDDSEQFKEKGQPTPQSILAELQRTGELLVSTLEFFKPLTASLAHAARSSQPATVTSPPDLRIHFSENDLDALAKKKPVRLGAEGGKGDSRTLITPQGKFFWGLTQELEEKALELEKQIEELKGSACFHSRKPSPHVQSHHTSSAHAHSNDVLPAIATALKEAGAKLNKSASSSSSPLPKLDPASTLLGSTSVALPGAPLEPKTSSALPSHGGPNSQFQSQNMQTPADAIAYLNQFVLPKSDNPPIPRKEMDAVGGPPGSGLANMSVNLPKMAKAARIVAEGGVGGGDIESMGAMAADLLGGVVVQGLEALVGAGLGFNGMSGDLGLGVDAKGNVTLGGNGVDVNSLVGAFENGFGSSAFGHAGYGAVGGLGDGPFSGGKKGRKSVLGMEEAEMAMSAARKDHEALEKKLGAVMKRNKKLAAGVGK